MKEKLDQLENLLTEIAELIEQRLEIEQVDLEEFDNHYKNDPIPLEGKEEYVASFRKTIVSYKNDRSFYENDIPQLESSLSYALKHLRAIKNDLSESRSLGKKNRPNDYIIKLLKLQLLTTKSPISGALQGKVFSGFLTEDGYLELNINGRLTKFGSLRYAAFSAWGKDISSQWKFWKTNNDSGEEKTLEYFKNLIDK